MFKQVQRGVRLAQIADLLVKHGLGGLLDLVGFRPRVVARSSREDVRERRLPVAHRVRLLLQDLGPTFIKLGQIASTRSDVIGEEFTYELRKLQDEVPPVSFEQVRMVVEEELGKPLEELYEFFDPTPVAAASIGQVHRARLKDGRAVAVKVQRMGVLEVVRNDMAILGWAARRMEQRIDIARRMNITGLLQEFEDLLMDEMVYTIEGHSADRMRQNLTSNPRIRIPEIIWPLTSRRVLTLEDVSGVKLSNRDQLMDMGINLSELASGLSQAYIKQILIDGFFHGDPHQGNFLVGPDGRIALIDFGIMGRLDERTRDTLVDMFIAVFRQDSESATAHLVSLGAVSAETDMVALTKDVDRLLSKYYFLPRSELRLGEVLAHVLAVVYRHDVHMPTDLALLTKVLLTIEGICLQLDPDFDFNASIRPFANELMDRSVSPLKTLQDANRGAREVARIARVLPTRVMDLLNKADRGQLRMIVQYDQSDRSLDHFYEMGNRLAMSISLAALMLGSALALRTQLHPFIGIAGYIISFLLICRLLMTLAWGVPPHRKNPPRKPR